MCNGEFYSLTLLETMFNTDWEDCQTKPIECDGCGAELDLSEFFGSIEFEHYPDNPRLAYSTGWGNRLEPDSIGEANSRFLHLIPAMDMLFTSDWGLGEWIGWDSSARLCAWRDVLGFIKVTEDYPVLDDALLADVEWEWFQEDAGNLKDDFRGLLDKLLMSEVSDETRRWALDIYGMTDPEDDFEVTRKLLLAAWRNGAWLERDYVIMSDVDPRYFWNYGLTDWNTPESIRSDLLNVPTL